MGFANYENRKSHVFISYVREDLPAVDKLCKVLASRGIEIWLDRKSIDPGVRWKQAIRRAIREGSFFIACFSDHYMTRSVTYMDEELTLAIEILRQHKTDVAWFIPVKLSNTNISDRDIGAGETLQDLQFVDLAQDWDRGVQRILELIVPSHMQIRRLLEELYSEYPSLRVGAAQALGQLRNTFAVPGLIEALREAMSQPSAYYLEPIWTMEDPAAVQERVCASIATALGEIGDPTAVQPLLSFLEQAISYKALGWVSTTSYAISSAIVKIGRPALPSLIDAVTHASPNMRLELDLIISRIEHTESLFY